MLKQVNEISFTMKNLILWESPKLELYHMANTQLERVS